MDPTRTFSARGVAAQKRGLKTLRELAIELHTTEEALAGAPKAEWHHDLRTGEQVWLYVPEKVWEWQQCWRSRLRMTPEKAAKFVETVRKLNSPDPA